eukprot:1195131-Prorocentrum_minimum.AAC.4
MEKSCMIRPIRRTNRRRGGRGEAVYTCAASASSAHAIFIPSTLAASSAAAIISSARSHCAATSSSSRADTPGNPAPSPPDASSSALGGAVSLRSKELFSPPARKRTIGVAAAATAEEMEESCTITRPIMRTNRRRGGVYTQADRVACDASRAKGERSGGESGELDTG